MLGSIAIVWHNVERTMAEDGPSMRAGRTLNHQPQEGTPNHLLFKDISANTSNKK
ncbi:hypothetical protein Sjap_015428 [Stephania japonica]|uniref:Uncharacterized protein n=1 Tax=Stephania japonica TaxID=461633 RepID=A0AAP0IJ36_9MAGN